MSKLDAPHVLVSTQTMSGSLDGSSSTVLSGSFEEANINKKRKIESKGRAGDPRMHRAVAARLKDPSLSLLRALLAGGFEFPEGVTDGVAMSTVEDADGVQLGQRKNQLSRRLRLTARRNISKHKRDKSPMATGVSCSSSSVVHQEERDGISEGEESRVTVQSNKSRQESGTCSFKQPARVGSLSNETPNTAPEQTPVSIGIMPPLVLNQFTASPSSSFLCPGQDVHFVSQNIGPGISLHPCVAPNEALNNIASHAVIPIPNMAPQCYYRLEAAPRLQQHSVQKVILPGKSKAVVQEKQKGQEEKAELSLKSESPKSTLQSRGLSSSNPKQTEKLRSALTFYQSESASLLKKCMLQAGFDPPETDECDQNFFTFLTSAIDVEIQRFDRLKGFFQLEDVDIQAQQRRKRFKSSAQCTHQFPKAMGTKHPK